MDLYFLDASFSLLDFTDDFSSVVWSEQFFSPGTFTLHGPCSLLEKVQNAVYVRTSFADDDVKCGRIDSVSAEDGDCKISGRLLEAMLSDRVIEGKGAYSGTVTEAALAAVEDNLRSLGVTLAAEQPLIENEVSFSYDYSNLADWLVTVLRPFGASYRITLDRTANAPVFSLVVGENRTSASGCTNPAVFSTSFGNIVSLDYTEDRSSFKNVAYVEGEDGTVVTLDKSGGGKRNELTVRADDISPDAFEGDDDYHAALRIRGEEALAERADGVRVSAECDPDSLPVYGVDFFLGDVCDVSDPTLGLSFTLRLVGADTVEENGVCKVYPSFGREPQTVRRLLAKR